jgi:hypothetical protein
MSGETELKTCFVPSCANHSKKSVEEFFANGLHYVQCLNCGAQGPEGNKRKESVDGWNEIARATPPGLETVPEGTMAVIQSLDDFQVEYKKFTRDNAPGNDYWSGKFLALIGSARAILTRHCPPPVPTQMEQH